MTEMTLLGRVAAKLRPGGGVAPQDVMAGPISAPVGVGDQQVTVKVDRVHQVGTALVIAGWSDREQDLGLRVAGSPVSVVCFRTARDDVARYLGLSDGRRLGFVLLAESTGGGAIELLCGSGGGAGKARGYPLRLMPGLPGREARIQLAPAIERLRAQGIAEAMVETDDESKGHGVGFAIGNLDDARSGTGSRFGVVSGWLVKMPGVEAWVESDDGQSVSLDQAHRVHRPDITTAVPAELSGYGDHAGFLLQIQGVDPGKRIRLVAKSGAVEATVAEIACGSWGSDPIAAARWLFSHPTPLTDFAKRVNVIDLPVLEGIISARVERWSSLPVRTQQVGTAASAVRASIVVPLYGRFDFVEHQLIEFARDVWLRENAELIYVIDDRELVERMGAEAWNLYRLYDVPFRWVWGETNRGFAGANNLGAGQARGRQLVFLNSDAIPRDPGWLEPMLDMLDNDPGIGAVGPRLLFGDGSLQHAAMVFRRREDLGIWVNHHPRMGLDPSLDPHAGPVDVPCVTGACLAIGREAFEQAGGWDTGYLVGDFEDSDLCLKLHAAGKRIVYLPQVVLTHLERQSFKLLGKGDFRTRVVIWNAVRHQQRWGREIEAMTNPDHASALGERSS